MTEPRWPPDTRNLINVLAGIFHKNLADIAKACARHEASEVVLQRHANEAFDTLGRIGLNRRPWYKRPDLETALGGLIFGAGASLPDVVSGLFDDFQHPILTAMMIACFIIGAGTVFHGWLRGSGIL
jgi:hypothetical protein